MNSIANDSLKENKIAVTVYISKDETVGVTPKGKRIPSHFRIGNGTMNKHRIQSIDLLQELADASKAGQFLILAIKNGITHDNDFHHIVKIKAKELTSYEKKLLVDGYKELYAKGIVVRTKQSHYMINPNALIPIDYEQALKDWEQAYYS